MIYVAKANDAVKIGYSRNPLIRISSLQTSSPYEIDVLLVIDGSIFDEHSLHKRFSHLRMAGEWFKFNGEIRDFIAEHWHTNKKYECGFEEHAFEGNSQLKFIRNMEKKTGEDVGNILGMTKQAISCHEENERNGGISLRKMQQYASALGYRFEYRFVKEAQNENGIV